MPKLKQYFGYIIAFLSATIGVLAFIITRKNREAENLKADIDLTVQEESSKVVDKEVSAAQKEIDTLSQEIKKPVSKDQAESDKFWKDYGDKK